MWDLNGAMSSERNEYKSVECFSSLLQRRPLRNRLRCRQLRSEFSELYSLRVGIYYQGSDTNLVGKWLTRAFRSHRKQE